MRYQKGLVRTWQNVSAPPLEGPVADDLLDFDVAVHRGVIRPDAVERGREVDAPIVDTGRTIGVSSVRNGGTATSMLKVFTDEAGNLITAFPL
jgi:hypothetical protein